MHCSRVFRSSAPSDLLPSSPHGRLSGTARVNAAALDQWNGGSAPVAECRTEGAVRQGNRPARHIPEGTLPGSVRSQGRVARCVIQNWSHVLTPIQQMPIQQVPLQSGPLQSGPLQQVKLTESAPEGTGEYPRSAFLGAPVPFGRGRQSADQTRDLAGWTSGELPGQVNEQLTSWPPSTDQPPASV